MTDQMLSFFAVGTLAEIAILAFMIFRRARGSCLVQLVVAAFALFTLVMLSVAAASMAAEPTPFTDGSDIIVPGAFVVLAGFIVAIRYAAPLPAAEPRKRPLILDMLGCAGLGILGIFLLVVGIGALTLFSR